MSFNLVRHVHTLSVLQSFLSTLYYAYTLHAHECHARTHIHGHFEHDVGTIIIKHDHKPKARIKDSQDVCADVDA